MDKITIALTVEQINVILGCLGNGPYVTVAPLIAEIQQQGQAQLNPVKTEAE